MSDEIIGRGLIEVLPDFRKFGREMAASMKIAAAQAKGSLQPIEGSFRDSQGRLRAANGAFLRDYQNGWRGAASTIVGSMAKVGKGVAIAAVGVGIVSLKMAGDFQKNTSVLQTAAGETTKGLAVVRKGILSISTDTGTGLKKLTDGMYLVEKAGYRGADGLKILKAAAQGAKEENADLSTVTNAMTSVMASYHLGAEKSVQVMNGLKTAAGEGKVTMEQFSGALSTVLPIASANKISFAQVAGAIATLTQHGTTAGEATQELASTIRNLASPNHVASQEMARLGLSSVDVATKLGQRGLTGTFQLLSETILKQMGPSGTVLLSAFNNTKQASQDAQVELSKMPVSLRALAEQFQSGKITLGDWTKEVKKLPVDQANLAKQFGTSINSARGFSSALKQNGPAQTTYTEALKKMSGGSIGLNTILQLTGSNMPGFQSRVKATGDSFNHASKDVEGWKQTQALFNTQLDKAKQAVNVLAVRIGTALIPVVTSIVGWFGKHTAVAKILLGVMAALAGAVLAAYVATKLYVAWTRIAAAAQWALDAAMDASPITWVVIAIVALIAAIVIIATKTDWFQRAWRATWGAIKSVVKAAWDSVLYPIFKGMEVGAQAVGKAGLWLWDHALKPAWNGIVAATKEVGKAFKWLWDTVLHPVFNVISLAARILFAVLVTVVFAPIVVAVHLLGKVFSWLWESAVKPAFDKIKAFVKLNVEALKALWEIIRKYVIGPLATAFTWFYDHVIVFVWNKIKTFVKLNVDALKILWEIIRKYVIGPLATAFRWFYDHVIVFVWNKVKAFIKLNVEALKALWEIIRKYVIGPLATAFTWFYDHVIKFVWNGIKAFIKLNVDALKALWEIIRKYVIGPLATAFTWLWHHIIEPVWNGIKSVISTIWNNGIKPIFDAVKSAVKLVGDAFGSAVNFIGKVWKTLVDVAKKPVNFIIDTVYTNGIKKLWDGIAHFVGLGSLPDAPKLLAAGGTIGPGPNVYSQPTAIVGEGNPHFPEYVIPTDPKYRGRARSLHQAAGMQLMEGGGILGSIWGGIKDVGSFVGHGVSSVLKGLGDVVLGALGPYFALGVKALKPLVDHLPGSGTGMGKNLIGVVDKMFDGIISFLNSKDAAANLGGANVAKALAWAKSQSGKPYVWGGVGPSGYDCSGFMGAIQNVIVGRNPNQRVWATGAFSGSTAPSGWKRHENSPFMIGITNAGVGHTAGTLDGTNVESSGGKGVHYGAGARGYKDSFFQDWYGFTPAISIGGGVGGSGVTRWTSIVNQSLGLLHQPPSYLSNTLRRMNQESGGNPTAVNRTDSNWLNGDPSVGLMQVISPTFSTYAGMMRNTGPFLYGVSVDPLANVYASMRYAIAQYGSIPRAYDRAGGYANGGILGAGKWATVGENGPEVISLGRTSRVYPNPGTGGGPVTVNLHVHGSALASKDELKTLFVQVIDQLRRTNRLPRVLGGTA